jgi:hypothetical protein
MKITHLFSQRRWLIKSRWLRVNGLVVNVRITVRAIPRLRLVIKVHVIVIRLALVVLQVRCIGVTLMSFLVQVSFKLSCLSILSL